ncbi:hypothetical protein H4R33_004640 [Dimargaris cristalligena]|uniref:Small ribosomal subunit protein uS8m n=1 Tax=Dimargaris cristalligena TaxID=215637 RepID=A0A4P9ZPU3_9FUNG|nr:hypothetical protein H4R33_004640 [Dimargaris cristalligena]RKP35275.1 30S ribosomal protein S8 [Dimargaris cristalligena]|eukprot:RKP35275.1 30S ribosomal protein S8 [Dimargaris cristalligena]
MPRIHDVCSHLQNAFKARLSQTCIPESKTNLSLARILYREGFVASLTRGSHLGPDGPDYVPTTPDNIATRRLWLRLKYKDEMPTLREMKCISKPSRKISAHMGELQRLAAGRPVGIVKPLRPGEIIMVETPEGILELQQAIKRGLHGTLLCRVF